MRLTIIIILVLLVACSQEAINQEPIKIGVSLPLTGEVSTWGNAIKLGIDLAVTEANEQGGIGDREIGVIYEDDKCSKEGRTAIARLIDLRRVDALLGPFCATAAGAGLPLAQDSQLPTIIFASAPKLTSIGDYVFRGYPSDKFAGEFMADYAFDSGKRRVAIVYVQNDWGKGLRDVFAEHFTDLGGEIVVDEAVNPDQRDVRSIAVKIQQADPDLIIAPQYPAVGLAFVRQLRELGIATPILGGDTFETTDFIENSGTEGVSFVSARVKLSEESREKFTKNGEAPHIGVALGYDGARTILEAIRIAEDKDIPIRDALRSIEVDGTATEFISFDENGDLKNSEYDVKILRNGKVEVIV